MSDDIETQMAKMHQEIATQNSKVAAKMAVETKEELAIQVDRLNAAVNTLSQKVQHLEQKYNLLLSKNFNTGSTVHGNNG